MKKFRTWVIENNKDFPYLNELPEPNKKTVAKTQIERTKNKFSWDSVGGSTYGEFLNFRGLQHAPVNEQGVVFLFGMIVFELGYVVEVVRTNYPDCEAKRKVKGKKDRWERVRIEFEYKSSHFKDHGHNPDECDVIVCWENNWHDCPLEVVELKTVIQELEG